MTLGGNDLRDRLQPGTPAPSAAAPPIQILVVDDEPRNLTVLATILDDPRYQIVRAESAEEALLALVRSDFALIILDIQMPVMTGFELAHMIKQRKKTAGIPIIFLTAYFSEDEHVLEGYETGAVDYLHKPVNAKILRSKVAVFAELHRATQELSATNRTLQAEVKERTRVQTELQVLNNELESRVASRTAELLAANAALRESEERLRMSQEAAKVGIWSMNFRTGRMLWTDTAWDIFDPEGRRETEGRRAELTVEKWLSCVHPEDRPRVEQAARTFSTSRRYRDEYRIGRSESGVRWVESVGAFETDSTGSVVGVRGAVRDITEQKELELELIEAGRRKDEFLAMLGHELRNPLAPIRNAVSILNKLGSNDPDINWCQEVIDRQSVQLTRIVDDLLDVSRVSRGKIQLHKTRLDLALAVQQGIETSRHLIDARGHTLKVTLPAGPLLVDGDLARLSQVVANLLNNAAKYTDEGGTIWLTVEPVARPEMAVERGAVIRIRDNGRGFDSTVHESLFSLFYQVDRNIDRSDGGLGIGLALVRSLVEMHGGTVHAHSAGRGHGSEFSVEIPCAAAPVRSEADDDPASTADSASSARILVVDDNQDAARTLGMLLTVLGHDVLLAHDGDQAIEVALRERPEVVFLDIGLPRRSGYEVCRVLRDRGLGQALIVAVTGYGQEQDRLRSDESGFDGHLVKPVGLHAIQKVLRERLQTDEGVSPRTPGG